MQLLKKLLITVVVCDVLIHSTSVGFKGGAWELMHLPGPELCVQSKKLCSQK